jgi:hypothetical protein
MPFTEGRSSLELELGGAVTRLIYRNIAAAQAPVARRLWRVRLATSEGPYLASAKGRRKMDDYPRYLEFGHRASHAGDLALANTRFS